VHVNLKPNETGEMQLFKRPVEPYVVTLDQEELRGYHRLRVASTAVEAVN